MFACIHLIYNLQGLKRTQSEFYTLGLRANINVNGALSGRRLPGELLLLEIQLLLIHAGKACLVEWVRKQKQRNARIHRGDGDYVGDIGPAFSNRGRALDENTLKWLLGKYRDTTSGGIFKIKQ